MKIVVAITGASGSIYAKRLIDRLCDNDKVEQIFVIFSKAGSKVYKFELGEEFMGGGKVEVLDVDNLFTAVASGSSHADAMVIVPCSMGTLSRVASGISSNLIERVADVQLKERAKLIVVARETPLSLIHLRAMTTLTEAGAVILPACPSFYTHPQTVVDVVDTVVSRIVKQITGGADRHSVFFLH